MATSRRASSPLRRGEQLRAFDGALIAWRKLVSRHHRGIVERPRWATSAAG
ncbi:MAG TPA: hypothetical protein VMV15_13840 [Candidatus Binataceae bacterium]|nr:hypothetical protein [Candidatus Binataceae bacterium]